MFSCFVAATLNLVEPQGDNPKPWCWLPAMNNPPNNVVARYCCLEPNHNSLLSVPALVIHGGGFCHTACRSICGAGDGVLLPKPIYPAFLNDLEVGMGLPQSLSGHESAVRSIYTQGAVVCCSHVGRGVESCSCKAS